MPRLLSVFATWLVLLLEGLKRPVRTIEVPSRRPPTKLVAVAIEGYEITIHAVRKDFIKEYANRFFGNKRFKVYHVFGIPSNDAPEDLKKACYPPVTFPLFYYSFVDDRLQRDHAIKAYLDILIDRLKEYRRLRV